MTKLDKAILTLLIDEQYTEGAELWLSPRRMHQWEDENPIEAFAINCRFSALVGSCYLRHKIYAGLGDMYQVTERAITELKELLLTSAP